MKTRKRNHSLIKAFAVASLLFIFFGTAPKAEAGTVTSWADFVSELQDPNISEITLGGPITKPANGAAPGTISRDITINGNGNTINFFTGTVNGVILGSVSAPTTLTLNNVDLHKYTTPGTAIFSGDGSNWTINLNSVTTGTQTTAAQSAILDAAGATVNISGTTSLRMQSAADVPHIKAASLNILDGASVTFAQTSYRHGGAFQGDTMLVGKNAVVDLGLWSNNGTGSNNAYGIKATTSVVLDEGASMKTGTITANYTTLISTGTFMVKENATFETSTTATNQTQIDATGAIDVMSGGTLNLTASGTNTTQVKSGAEEFVVRNGSNINVNYTYGSTGTGSNTTSYSFYVNKFVVEDNAVFKHVAAGTGHRIYANGLTIGKGADVEVSTTSVASTDANIYLVDNATLLIKENAKFVVSNAGTATTVTAGTNLASGAAGSHGIYGSIADFTIEPKATVDINVNTVGYWTRVKNSMTMTGGAVLNSYSKNREAVLLSYDFGDGEHADKPATINISGQGTLLNMASDNTSFIAQEGATMRVQGDGSSFNLSDGAELTSRNDRSSALQMQSQNSVFNVTNGAKMHLIKDTKSSTTNYTIGAALRFRIRGTQTFNIDGGEVTVESKGNTSPGIRMFGSNNAINVSNAGQLRVINYGNGGSASDADKAGIEYTSAGSGSLQQFTLVDENSLVEVEAQEGPAITSEGTNGSLKAEVTEGTIFILDGITSGNNRGGAIQVRSARLDFTLAAPKYFDMRNRRKGTATNRSYVLENGDATSTMVATKSDLSVWKSGTDLEGNPFKAWSIFDYTLTGTDFVKIDSTNVPLEFNTNADSYGSIGAQAYSRMSANNASAVVDDLRVPTNADKYIFGHASVPEGLDDIRDAWTDEVYVEVQVYNPDGTPAFKATGVTVGEDDNSPGVSVYGETANGGIFTIPVPDGKFLVEGMTAEVLAAWRGGVDSQSNRVHTSDPEKDILTGEVVTIDVTPPTQATSSTDLTNATKQLSGTSDENGSKVFVKINNEWLKDGNGDPVTTTVANGSWIINLPAYVEENDNVDIYLKDNTVITPEPVYTLPGTYTMEPDGVYGNINEVVDGYDTYAGYHDAVKSDTVDERFDSALRLTATNVLPKEVSLEKTAKVYRKGELSSDAQVGDTVEYTLTAKNLTANTFWNDIVLTDVLPTQVDFDPATAEVKINGTAAAEGQANYDSATRTLTVNAGDVTSAQGLIVTFNVKINTTAAGTNILNTATADGESLRETPFEPGAVNPNADHEVVSSKKAENTIQDVYGTLSLTSAPTEIDFGTKTTGVFGALKVTDPEIDQHLVVNDSRAVQSNWTLTATLKKVMTSLDDEAYTLADSLKYKSDNSVQPETMYLNQAVVVAQHTNPAPGDYDVSQAEWKDKDNGFVMDISATQYRLLGDYQAIIEFTVADTYTP